MNGFRIQLVPGKQRGAAGVKIDTKVTYGSPLTCRQCQAIEFTRHLHLRLDDADATIVSGQVVAHLRELGYIDTVFVVTNEAVGPTQVINLGAPIAREDFLLIGAA